MAISWPTRATQSIKNLWRRCPSLSLGLWISALLLCGCQDLHLSASPCGEACLDRCTNTVSQTLSKHRKTAYGILASCTAGTASYLAYRLATKDLSLEQEIAQGLLRIFLVSSFFGSLCCMYFPTEVRTLQSFRTCCARCCGRSFCFENTYPIVHQQLKEEEFINIPVGQTNKEPHQV